MEKKYQLVCYMRVEPEELKPLTYEQALQDKQQLELMQPDNIYRIEEIDEVEIKYAYSFPSLPSGTLGNTSPISGPKRFFAASASIPVCAAKTAESTSDSLFQARFAVSLAAPTVAYPSILLIIPMANLQPII
ncbi:MAG: hypothetical protein JSV83_13410 [Desulfobacterales bacterium]|nr:MAG: hypothetical protein JSV83_13410 [Desulfobacterales bacterium]